MKQLLSTALLLTLTGAQSFAQQQPAEPTKLKLYPAPAPVPALRFRLLPEQRDLTPGNAATVYYRAFSPEWMHSFRNPKYYERLVDAAKAPLKDLTAGEFAQLRQSHQLKELDLAARRTFVDWEFQPRLREQGVNMLLPDMQSMRLFGTLLAVRTRAELAKGRYDDAARSLQTGLSLSRHIADGPVLIQGLIGIAITMVQVEQIETWIQQPSAPNLFWALASLPRPFADLRKGLEGERAISDNLFSDLREQLRRQRLEPMSPAELDKLQAKLRTMLQATDGQVQFGALQLLVASAKLYPVAKKFLIDQGWPAETVGSLPVTQVVLLHQVALYDNYLDELAKWQGQPYPTASAAIERATKQLQAEEEKAGLRGLLLVRQLLPALTRVDFAAVRLQRRLDVLRIIEALRLYAAGHDRKLPETLEAMADLPLPLDPATGKAYHYQRTGARATLIAPVPPGAERLLGQNLRNHQLRYEIEIAPR